MGGSIPSIVGDMVSLKEVLLFNNRLRGTFPSEFTKLYNMSRLSISYNALKGAISSDIRNLQQLKLFHLHQNLLTGDISHFNYSIQSFIADCGNTERAFSLVTCEKCTECCNLDGLCITQAKTWPNYLEHEEMLASGVTVM